MSNNFCPIPWIGMFYIVDSAGVCCVDSVTTKTSPQNFKNTEHVKQLKKEFILGQRPVSCNSCWQAEDAGMQSIRKHLTNRFIDYMDTAKFNEDTNIGIKHLEIRASNLCNFKCRMCNSNNSIEIDREVHQNPILRRHFKTASHKDNEISDSDWEEIKQISLGLESLILTGGEPLLIKKYYDLMDHLIDNEKIQEIILMIYTHCSVYNPKFVEKMLKFKKVGINLSIDAVGKVAEYQRHGTIWPVVRENIFKFIELPNVFATIHSTITAYTILDFSNLADLYLEIYSTNNKVDFKAHTINHSSPLSIKSLVGKHRDKALEQIELSLNKLQHDKFKAIRIELSSIQLQLMSNTTDNSKFVEITRALDTVRKESFDSTFNINLTDQ